jgi:hypothetical protein
MGKLRKSMGCGELGLGKARGKKKIFVSENF